MFILLCLYAERPPTGDASRPANVKTTEVHQVHQRHSCREVIPAIGRSGCKHIPVDVRQRLWNLRKDFFRYLKTGTFSEEHPCKVMHDPLQ